jgi:adenylate cyclase class 2
MKYEVEQKFRVGDLLATERALRDLGATVTSSIKQSDTYFSHPARDFRKTDEILRLRCDGDANCITYKGPRIDSETKTRLEIEIDLEAGDSNAERSAVYAECSGSMSGLMS